ICEEAISPKTHGVKLHRLSGKNLLNRRLSLKPLTKMINLLIFQRRTSIPVTWGQVDMLVKLENGRKN
ncbi:hypothetical protein, partial [Sulfurimonas sp.]|uniref:hypothetical protein n=1 Tax=Sulfurimonas sp. TaxID=2022749 RepID=UPI003D115075